MRSVTGPSDRYKLLFIAILFLITPYDATASQTRSKKKNSPSASLWKKELKTDGKFLLGSALVALPFPITFCIQRYLEQHKYGTFKKGLLLYTLCLATVCMMGQGYQYLRDAHNELIELDKLEDKQYGPATSKTYRYVGNATIVGGVLALLFGYSSLITAAHDYMLPDQIYIPDIRALRRNFLATRDHQIQTALLLLAGPLLVRLGYKIKSLSKPETASTETISTSGQ